MGRGGGGYVNLLSHSPVDTPCPEYRICASRDALLNNAEVQDSTTPLLSRYGDDRSNICPVQIHSQSTDTRRSRRCTREIKDSDAAGQKIVREGHVKRTANPYNNGRRKDNTASMKAPVKNSSKSSRFHKTSETVSKIREGQWVNLDQDYNTFNEYILIDDKFLGAGDIPNDDDAAPFPDEDMYDDETDVDSHGKYDSLKCDFGFKHFTSRAYTDLEVDALYPLANSHENAYQDSNSHNKYSEMYSNLSSHRNLDTQGDTETGYSMSANSHSDYTGTLSESKNDNYTDNINYQTLGMETNYEIANSHSNYRVFYDSQAQRQIPLNVPKWPPDTCRNDLDPYLQVSVIGNTIFSNETDQQKADLEESPALFQGSTRKTEKKHESEVDAACDIEQCLMQIEESLINIEQNLLHVQDLDIPELRNLLYKSPSIERSLYEVHDLLYSDSIESVTKQGEIFSLDSKYDDNVEEEDEKSAERWIEHNFITKDADNADDDTSAPFIGSNDQSSDTANQETCSNKSRSTEDPSSGDCVDETNCLRVNTLVPDFQSNVPKAVNFVPNSLSKTPPKRTVLDETKENIRLCSSGPDESLNVDYNLNYTVEKKLLCRDKCHSRTNSLDENSLQSSELGDKRTSGYERGKISLQNLHRENLYKDSFDVRTKAKSESTLQSQHEKAVTDQSAKVNVAEGNNTRCRTENIAQHRRSTLLNMDNQKKQAIKEFARNLRDASNNGGSPTRMKRTSTSSDKEKEVSGDKTSESDKRKRKKLTHRGQNSSENALVPNKLISLSLSLLLAALLQAVRCLTDLVEDAFRSVNYDRNGLLQ